MVGIYRSYGACPSPIGWERVAAGWVRVFNLWFYKDAAPDGAGGGSGGKQAEKLADEIKELNGEAAERIG
jgi:hypothetical protein